MNREKLINAFRQSATAKGYAFHTDEVRHMPHTIKKYPAVWLSPPEFQSMEGINHGSVVYAVRMHAMKEGAKMDAEAKVAAGIELEQSVVDIFCSLSDFDFVAEVDKLKIEHKSQTLTTHGEVGVTATAEVITIF